MPVRYYYFKGIIQCMDIQAKEMTLEEAKRNYRKNESVCYKYFS